MSFGDLDVFETWMLTPTIWFFKGMRMSGNGWATDISEKLQIIPFSACAGSLTLSPDSCARSQAMRLA